MNTKKFRLHYKNWIVIILLLITYTSLSQTSPDIISRTAKTTSDCKVSVDSPGIDAEIVSWAQNEIKVEYSLQIEGKTPEEKQLFLASFSRQLENQLKESIQGSVRATVQIREIIKNNNNIKIKLSDDSREYKLTKFTGKVKIFVPGSNPLSLSSSFNPISVGDFTSDVSIDINSADFKLGNCKKLTASMNFSGKSTVGKVEMAIIDCNSSTLAIQQVMKDLELNANFSTLTVGKIGNKANLNLNSSSFECGDLVTLSLNGNFVRNCKVNNVDMADIELNSSEFSANKIRVLKLKGINFSTLRVGEVNDVSITEASSTEFSFTKLAILKSMEVSFCHFNIGTLTELLMMNASSGDIQVNNVMPGFKNIDIKGNFVTTNIKMSAETAYSLFADLTFPDYDFGNLTLKKEKSDLNHEVIRGQKGSPKAGISQVNLACQSCDISIK